jgi:hypothetical protein
MAEDPFDLEDVNSLLIFKKIFAISSLIILFFVALLFWFSEKVKKKIINKCILYLTLIEIGYLISVLLPYNNYNPDTELCFAEALLINFFSHCRLVWCFLMTYICIMESMNKLFFENHEFLISIIFLLMLILIPALTTLYLSLKKLSGNYGVYCLLPLNNEEMRFYIIKIHIYYTAFKIGFILITFYCIFQSRKNKKILKNFSNYRSNHKYLIYPKIICFMQTLDVGTNIYKIILINSSNYFIELAHIFLNCSEGIVIFIFLVRSSLFQTLFSRFYKKFKKKRDNKKKRGNTFRSINSLIKDKNTSPIIDNNDSVNFEN